MKRLLTATFLAAALGLSSAHAQIAISQLPRAQALSGVDQTIVNQLVSPNNMDTRQTTLADIAKFVGNPQLANNIALMGTTTLGAAVPLIKIDQSNFTILGGSTNAVAIPNNTFFSSVNANANGYVSIFKVDTANNLNVVPIVITSQAVFANGAIQSLNNVTTGFGTKQAIWSQVSASAGFATIFAARDDYNTTPTSIGLTQYGATATGNTAGFPNTGLQALTCQNASICLFNTYGSDIVLAPGNVEQFRIKSAGGLTVAGTAGVTCTGTPTSSFASKNGIVTHC